MADIQYYEEESAGAYFRDHGASADGGRAGGEIAGGRWQALINWIGALASLALLAGMAVWAWQQVVRDVSGVPVIEALEGPMRIAPEDPGGVEAENQGLAVNLIAEGEEAAPAADRIALAPPPVALPESTPFVAPVPRPSTTPAAIPGAPQPGAGDDADGAMAPPAADTATDPAAGPAPRPESDPGSELVAADTAETAGAEGGSLAAPESSTLTSAEAPAGDPTPEAASEATLALIAELMEAEAETTTPAIQASLDDPGTAGVIEVLDISIPGLRRSLRPIPRPSTLEVRVAATVTESLDAGLVPQAARDTGDTWVTNEIDAATLAPGTRLVQLGAFDDPESARAEWERLAERFPSDFSDRDRIVQSAVTGGREFYRLRVHGFDDLMDARRFCTPLLAEGAACIPVTVREADSS